MAAHDSITYALTDNPDAELVVLGFELEAAWRAERAYVEANPDADWPEDSKVHALVERIQDLKATTFDGILVKARACAWRCGGGMFTECDGTDVGMALSCANDLMAMAEALGAYKGVTP